MSANETHYGNICFDSTADEAKYQYYAIPKVNVSDNSYECPYQLPTQKSTDRNTTDENENKAIQLEKALLQKKSMSLKLKILSGVLLLFVTIVLVEAALLLKANQPKPAVTTIATEIWSTETSTREQSSTPLLKPSSCLDYKNAGYYSSGIYIVFSEDETRFYDVFCDMETDGGGWTLVASIHEDDIEKKCSSKDRWSTLAESVSHNRTKTAWENKETFGAVPDCTSDDYKNPGYYSIKADDVMIWHVPNNSPIDSMRDIAKVRYRSTNNFLKDVGGNLFSVLKDYYSLDVKEDYSGIAATLERTRTDRVAAVLDARKNQMTSVINDWYSYKGYSSATGGSYIRDNELYDIYGNIMTMDASVFSPEPNIYYNVEMWWGERTRQQFSTISKTTQPFMMMGAIENRYLENSYIALDIYAHQQNPRQNFSVMDELLEMGNFKFFYSSIQYVVDNYNTACEFHYIVYNEKEWRSTRPSGLRLYNLDISSSDRQIGYKMDGYPTNVVMGYILLARNSSSSIHKDWLDEVAKIVLGAISEVPDLFDAFGGSDGLAVPVTFDVGDENTILTIIPYNLRTSVEPGYLQLRAYNQIGFPNALCPGVRMTYHPSEFVCIGGISNNASTCGDFAGWEGEEEPNIYAGSHYEKDIYTSILIFYR